VIETSATPFFSRLRRFSSNRNESRKKREKLCTKYDVERSIATGRILHHSLELGAPIVGRGRPGFYIFGNDVKGVLFTASLKLSALVGNG
jgi:hypothetical protein